MNILFRYSEAGCQSMPHSVGILRGIVHGEFVTVPGSDRGMGFHWIVMFGGSAISLVNTNLSRRKPFIHFASFDVGRFPSHRMRLGCFGPLAVQISGW